MSEEKAINILSNHLNDLIDELSDESDYCNEGKIDLSDDFWERSNYADSLKIAIESLENKRNN